MRKHWILASTLLISSCSMVRPASLGASLILKPQVQAGSFATKTTVTPYTQASINHLILKLYTFDGSEHDLGIQKSIPGSQLSNSVTFSNLRANNTYRIKAYAYFSADESTLISTTDSNSYTDVALTTNDHPTITSLIVKLIDRSFNGQATASGVVVTNGGYAYASSESLTIPCLVSTLAGQAQTSGYADASGTSAKLSFPIGVAADSAGNVYVADDGNHLIRKITNVGVVSTLAGGAGTTTAGFADGQGTAAKFNQPIGVAVDGAGNIYVGDSCNNLVRKITSGGNVTTFAGQAQTIGYADAAGTAAKFNNPRGLALDGAGNIYVADTGNNLIRKISSGGVVSSLAGGAGATAAGYADGQGTAAKFNAPTGVAVDGSGNVYVADSFNHLIRKISNTGLVSTLAGGLGATAAGYLDGQGTAAKFNLPRSVALDSFGNLYVADRYNNLIRKITTGGLVSTLAGGVGGTTAGYADGMDTTATFNNPNGVTVDWAGNIYVADYGNHLIRRLR